MRPDSVWNEGTTWICVFGAGSVLAVWGILSLPVAVDVRVVTLGIIVVLLAVACLLGRLLVIDRLALPALNRTPRSARVREILEYTDKPESSYESAARKVVVEYIGADGLSHRAVLGDVIHESSIERFAPGSTWQVFAFRDPAFAASTVLLTDAHDDVCRSGYTLEGIDGIPSHSTLIDPAPGSPLLRGQRRFES